MLIPEAERSRFTKIAISFFTMVFASIVVIARYGSEYSGLHYIVWVWFMLVAVILLVAAIFLVGRKLSWDWNKWD